MVGNKFAQLPVASLAIDATVSIAVVLSVGLNVCVPVPIASMGTDDDRDGEVAV